MSESCKKKRRRSSLAPAKIKGALSPGNGLEHQVEESLSPEERLEKLSQLCLKFAVNKVKQESESEETRESLSRVEDELLKVTDSKEHKEAVANACHNAERLLPNPANVEMADTINDLEKRINRLAAEEQDWYDLFAEIDRHTAEAEGKAESLIIPVSEVTEEQKNIAKEYLPEMADLNLTKEQLKSTVDKICILVCEHKRALHVLSQKQISRQKQLDEAVQRLQERTFPNMGSPRASVQNLIELPTPPRGPNDVEMYSP